ncbi:MAG: hypothetical protein E7054_05415 [Lentisphaerae bacterium]|nr:hypothetical protein [Lentisphaerota bacterium]
MKIADMLKITTSGINFAAYASGDNSIEVSTAEQDFLNLGQIRTAGFDGALSLPEKLRCHRTNDNLCAEFDSVSVIPFGCEYRVKRHWTLFSNIALLNCDITADNGGTIRDLELEPVEIMLAPEKIEFLIRGESALRTVENASGIIYSGPAPVLMLRVSGRHGNKVEYVCGDDIWRHCAAEKIAGVSSDYQIAVENGKTVLTRKVLIASEEAVMEKRPWKFKSIFSWSTPETSAVQCGENAEKFSVPGCFASAAAHREIRKVVRAAGNDRTLVMQGEFPVICHDPAHLERPAKNPVEHSDLGAAALDYLWANRELAKRGSRLIMESNSTLYGDSVVLSNLGKPITEFEEE